MMPPLVGPAGGWGAPAGGRETSPGAATIGCVGRLLALLFFAVVLGGFVIALAATLDAGANCEAKTGDWSAGRGAFSAGARVGGAFVRPLHVCHTHATSS